MNIIKEIKPSYNKNAFHFIGVKGLVDDFVALKQMASLVEQFRSLLTKSHMCPTYSHEDEDGRLLQLKQLTLVEQVINSILDPPPSLS